MLRAYRQSAGLSQQDVADRSGVAVRTISDLERGRTRWPYRDSLRRLADALGLAGAAKDDFIATAGRRVAHANSAAEAGPLGSDAGSPAGDLLVPRFLPLAVRGLVGRDSQLAALSQMLDQVSGTALVIAISGIAGVGKTALAVHWAHRITAKFPDGQLFVNLRGFSPHSTRSASVDVICGLLDALGVCPEQVPASLENLAGLYRSLIAGKRLLIVLDNARDEQQARLLLPGSPGCLAIVTSRNQLTGLSAAEGAHLLTLDVLTDGEARTLLAARLGTDRTDAEPEAVAEIVTLSAGLPLALAVIAARAAARPKFSLSALAAEWRHAPSRLDALDSGDPAVSVRTVFSWSCQQLTPAAAEMFRLLGLHLGSDITVPAAASLAGILPCEAHLELAELARENLIIEHAPGRYLLHDLLRLYAAEQTRDHASDT
jgi:transcriptional regulator with XRE-family HTH domain